MWLTWEVSGGLDLKTHTVVNGKGITGTKEAETNPKAGSRRQVHLPAIRPSMKSLQQELSLEQSAGASCMSGKEHR